jgi:phage RecT family recombinase
MTKLEEFKQTLIDLRPSLEPLLKSDVDKFIQITANFMEQKQNLLESNRTTLLKAIMDAAQCHLFIDGQESAIVPFKGAAKFMSMYKGILKMVRNSGELASINSQVVYDKDQFDYYIDEKGEHLTHKPVFSADRGKPLMTYCIARTKGNEDPYVEVMTEKEISDCKNSSRAGSDSPWNGLFADEMRKKTVIRRISKRLPMSTDLNSALHSDDELFNAPEEVPEEPKEIPTTPRNLQSKLSELIPETKTESVPLNSKPAPAEAKPVSNKPVLSNYPVGSMIAEGVITETKAMDVTVSGVPSKRYIARIGESQYGTFNPDMYMVMQEAKQKNVAVWIVFEIKQNKAKANYNEAVDLVMAEIPEDDIVV